MSITEESKNYSGSISAEGGFDEKSIKALTRVTIFGRSDPKIRTVLFLSVSLFLFLLSIAVGIAWGFDREIIMLCASTAALALIELWIFVLMPNLQAKASAKLKDAVNSYEFREDDFTVTTSSQDMNGSSDLNYASLKRICETDEYLFLFLHNNTAFIVDKGTIDNYRREELEKILRKHVKKYIRCKY